jgi:hypothetical protein
MRAHHLIRDCYEDYACIKSDLFQPFLALLSTLDPIDFNLFVKEEDIPRGEFGGSWAKIFAHDRINFDRLHPPIRISLDLLKYLKPFHLSISYVGWAHQDSLLWTVWL